jgi:hypothetical protein
VQVKDIFEANSRSVCEFFSRPGTGFYVPAYQRPYSWDTEKVKRLFEDSMHGLKNLISYDDAVTFIGTIINIHDTTYATVHPFVQGNLPSKVLTIIDGQQRISTLILYIIVLHNEIKTLSDKIKFDTDYQKQFKSQLTKTYIQLEKCFNEKQDHADDERYAYYPRIIRAFEDTWSIDHQSKYISPVPMLINQYSVWLRSDTDEKFKFKYHDITHKEDYEVIDSRINEIRKIVNLTVKEGCNDDLPFPNKDDIIRSEHLRNSLFHELQQPAEFQYYDQENDDFAKIFRLFTFSKFLLHRIAITEVTAKNEDYAFDVFEALNTTGEPLTAYETFKPRVIQNVGLPNCDQSNSYKYLSEVDLYLKKNPNDKQKTTAKLIVTFALSENGSKLSERLAPQRSFLKRSYELLGDNFEKEQFVKSLYHSSQLMQCVSNNKKIDFSNYVTNANLAKEIEFPITVIANAKHTISYALLSRFFENIIENYNDGTVNNFLIVARATCSFLALWRLSRISTDNIDNHFRGLILEGYPNIVGPICRIDKERRTTSLPDPISIINAYKKILADKGNVIDLESWVSKTTKIPAFNVNKSLAKFVLLGSAHDTIADTFNPGMIKKARLNTFDTLNYKSFSDESVYTIEHVAPQNNNSDYDENIYSEDLVHTLGNLSLLPPVENSSISDRPWNEKKLMFKILSCQDEQEVSSLISEAKDKGINLTQSTENILKNAKYYPHLRALHSVDTWDTTFIKNRSVNIASLFWNNMAGWLNLPL